MAHNLDITDGQASFVSARVPAWHRLGTVLENTFDASTAMEEGLLGNWDVRKIPLTAISPDDGIIPIPDRFAVLRNNPVTDQPEGLGVVGSRYTVIQNEEHAQFLDNLVHESGAHFETAGALDGGRKVFIGMKMPGHIKVGGVDPVDLYLTALNSHDGSTPFTILTTPVRVVCENTLNMAMGSAKNIYRVRHSGRSLGKLIEAQHALEMSFEYLDAFKEEAERLINTEMTILQFEEMIEKEFGPGEGTSSSALTRADRRKTELFELFSEAGTQEGVRNTAWAGLNAIVEWQEHFSPATGDARDERRAYRALFEPYAQEKALQLVHSFSK